MGAHTCQSALVLEKGLDVHSNKILKALDREDQLMMAMNRKLKWKKRGYNVLHSNESAEIDKADLPNDSYKKNYFLLVIDFFNKMIYTEEITEKDLLDKSLEP